MVLSRRSFAVVLACVLWAASAPAAETITLKSNHHAGDTFTFDQNMSMQLNIAMSSGGQVMQKMTQNMTQMRAGKVQVIEAQNGEVTKATITFANNCGGTMAMEGAPPQPVPFALTGKSVNVTRQADGTYKSDAQVDPAVASELDGYVRTDSGMYPKQPVAVGDSWDIAPDELAKAMQMQPGTDGNAKAKLVKLTTVNGRQVADVDVSIKLSGEQPGAGKMTIVLSGPAQIDVATGRSLGGQLVGPMTIAGQQQQGGQVIDVQGDGQITLNTKGSVTGGQAGEVIAQNPNPDPMPITPDPVTPTAAPDFKGTFSNDKLTLTLDGSGGNSTGKIVMGTKEFTCTGKAAGNTLTGSFTSGTSEFPFTATLNGDAMTFKTGSSSYDLKRKSTVKNPLE